MNFIKQVIMIAAIIGITYCSYRYYHNSYLQPVHIIVEKSDDVRIQSETAHTCSSNSDCKSGNCYGGFCEACTLVGGPCGNDGQCCKSNCADGFCGGTAIAAGWSSGAGITIAEGTVEGVDRLGYGSEAKMNLDNEVDNSAWGDDMQDFLDNEEDGYYYNEATGAFDKYEPIVENDAAADGETTQEYLEPYEASAEADAPEIEAGAEVAATDEVALLPEEGAVALGVAEVV